MSKRKAIDWQSKTHMRSSANALVWSDERRTLTGKAANKQTRLTALTRKGNSLERRIRKTDCPFKRVKLEAIRDGIIRDFLLLAEGLN